MQIFTASGSRAGLLRRAPHGGDAPLRDRRVGELEDEAVAGLPRERERLRPVGGDPDRRSRLCGFQASRSEEPL